MPFQFRFTHESNKLKKSFTFKDKQNHLRRSSIVYCTNYDARVGQITLDRLAEI